MQRERRIGGGGPSLEHRLKPLAHASLKLNTRSTESSGLTMSVCIDRRAFACLAAALISQRGAASPPLVRMAYFDRYEPFSQRANDGSMSGLLIEGVELIGWASGLRLEHHGFPWARAQLLVERGELDGLCTVPTPARRAWMEFCETPVVRARYGVFHRADDPRPAQMRSVEDLRQFRQGSYRGSGYSRGLLNLDHLQVDNDAESVLRRIAMDTLDTFIESDLIVGRKVQQLGLSKRITFTPLPFLPPAAFCFGLRKSFPGATEIVGRMEAATQASQQSGALTALLEKHR